MEHDIDNNMMQRRMALSRVVGLMAGGLGLVAFGGCASRAPAPPAAPPKPLRLVAVMPVTQRTLVENTGFGARAVVPVVVPVNTGQRGSGGSAAAAVGVGLVGLAVAYGVASRQRSERAALLDALSAVDFDPAGHVNQRLADVLAQRGVQVVRVTDPDVAAEVWSGQFGRLPPGVDAVLDVSVLESGYYSSMRAGGYSPQLHLRAVLLPTVPDAEELASFSYYADWRDAGKETRWVTTPKALTFEKLEGLKAEAASVRAGLGEVADRLVGMVVGDVQAMAAVQVVPP